MPLRWRQTKAVGNTIRFSKVNLLLDIATHKSEHSLSILTPSHSLSYAVIRAIPADIHLTIPPSISARSVFETIVPSTLIDVTVFDIHGSMAMPFTIGPGIVQ